MTKTLINIPENILSSISFAAKSAEKSRSQLIREVLSDWLAQQVSQSKSNNEAFGILKNHKIDGMKLQHKLRKEW
jgi:metal-responsive CopG/Arc/MetJ family transcriptional regulator